MGPYVDRVGVRTSLGHAHPSGSSDVSLLSRPAQPRSPRNSLRDPERTSLQSPARVTGRGGPLDPGGIIPPRAGRRPSPLGPERLRSLA